MTWLALWLGLGLLHLINYWCRDQEEGGWHCGLGALLFHWMLWPLSIGVQVYFAFEARRTYAQFRAQLGPDWRKRLHKLDTRSLEFVSKAVGERDLDPIYRSTGSAKSDRAKPR